MFPVATAHWISTRPCGVQGNSQCRVCKAQKLALPKRKQLHSGFHAGSSAALPHNNHYDSGKKSYFTFYLKIAIKPYVLPNGIALRKNFIITVR